MRPALKSPIAIAKMSLAVRDVSVAKGYDPRDFALVASGGAGPLHVVAIARELEMSAKNFALYISWREHTIIIQSKLTNRYNFRFLSHFTVMGSNFIVICGRIMGMCPHPCKDSAWMCLRQRQRGST